MPRGQIRCQNCGTRAELDLSDGELQALRSRGHIVRYCNRCAGNTKWISRAGPGASWTAGADLGETRGGRILLIDDDENILKILSKVLSAEKFEIDLALSGRDAILKLGREDYDLVLSDIRMPELDGTQLFEFLDQNMPEYKNKVMFLTGDTGNPETMKFLERANCPYLTKPIEIPTLVHLLYQFFSAA